MGRIRTRHGMGDAAEHGAILARVLHYDHARVAIALAGVHENFRNEKDRLRPWKKGRKNRESPGGSSRGIGHGSRHWGSFGLPAFLGENRHEPPGTNPQFGAAGS